MRSAAATLALVVVVAGPARAQGPDTVFIEELTWTEVRDRIASGTTSVILPTGGTEQNGPHMVLGKHNFIVKVTAERIAREIGHTLVAPVVSYVPEGNLDPPSGHMRYPGAITLPNDYFMKLLEYAARSFRANGFTNIIFIGDSGGNQGGLQTVAEALNAEWAGSDVRVHFVGDYYRGHGIDAWLQEQGETEDDIGSHAGIRDTSQLMAVDPRLIRMDERAKNGGFEDSGVRGNPTKASVEYGRVGLQMKVDAAVKQIRDLMAQPRSQ